MRGSAPVQADDPRPLLATLIVHANDVRSVGAREDDAPAGQLLRGTHRQLTRLVAGSRPGRGGLTFTAVRARRGQSDNERETNQALAALHASLLHRCGPPRFRYPVASPRLA